MPKNHARMRIFWVSVMLLIPLANQAARLELRMLNHPVARVGLILLLSLAWTRAHRRTLAQAINAARLTFEDAAVPEIFSLTLDRR